MGEKAKKLRELLGTEPYILAPNAFDALSARLIEHSGFKMLSTSSSAVHAAELGTPDLGLLSFGEMLEQYTRIADSVDIPLFVDGEAGYGNAINVIRTVKLFERAGIAGMFIEDQQLPTNCPAVKAVKLVSKEEMIGKIKAAVDARTDENFLIVARTDAPFEEACERANAYLEAGADMIKPMPKSRAELEGYAMEIHGPMYMSFNGHKGCKNEGMTYQMAADLGYRIITFPAAGILARIKAEMTVYEKLLNGNSWDDIRDLVIQRSEMYGLLDKYKYDQWIDKYVKE